MATKGKKESVEVDGRTIRFTHPDKVLYEATGTTKADVLEYYLAVAPLLMTYAGRRPVTRKRWPDGTDDKSFFEKNLPSHAPDWVPRVAIEHSSRTVRYPVLDSPAALAWFAKQAALELHVPQWTLANDEPGRTRRIRPVHGSPEMKPPPPSCSPPVPPPGPPTPARAREACRRRHPRGSHPPRTKEQGVGRVL